MDPNNQFYDLTECQINTCPTFNTKCHAGYKPVISVPDGKCCPELICGELKIS